MELLFPRILRKVISMRKTKIICTVGPSTDKPEILENMMGAISSPRDDVSEFAPKMDVINVPTDKITDPIPVLYQSGYLTIKDYNEDTKQYLLGFPNEEVRQGLSDLFSLK